MSASNNLENIDKFRFIQLVRSISILWDSSLPNFKGADSEKLAGWTDIGKEFDFLPQKAERSFRRLRELYRKELVKERSYGDDFKSQWEFFDCMDFLRPVIKERKSGLYRDLKIPTDDYAYYIGLEHGNRKSSTVCSELVTTTMTEIPIEGDLNVKEIETKPKIKHRPFKRSFSSEACESSSSASFSKIPRSDLYEKFGNLVASKLSTLDDAGADDQMKDILKILFN